MNNNNNNTEEEVCKEVFSYYADINGKVSPGDLVTIVRALGRNPDEQDLREACKAEPLTLSSAAPQTPASAMSLTKTASVTLRPPTANIQGSRPSTSTAIGEITVERFLRIWKRLKSVSNAKRDERMKEVKSVLQIFNKEGRGKVWLRDVQNVMSVIGAALSPEELDRLENDLGPFCPANTIGGAGPVAPLPSPPSQPSQSSAGTIRDPWLPFNDMCDFLMLPYY